MSDMEIYVDNLAAMQIHNMNKYIEFTRAKLQEKGTSTTDHYMKTLEAATIKEDDYFANLLGSDIAGIAKDIKEAHKKDSNTGNDTTEVDEIEEAFEQIQKTDNATQAQMIMYSKMFKINFTKMEPYEFKTFTEILQGYAHLNISLFLYVLPHIRYILLINIIISLSLKKEYQFYFLLSVTICFTEELGFLSSSLKNVG